MLAFWLGSVTTDANGHAQVDVTLPESLTTYRIMAVAADRNSRFGSGDSEVRINKPITMKPTLPRFLAVGDIAHFGAVDHQPAQVRRHRDGHDEEPRSIDPRRRRAAAAASCRSPPGGSVEAQFQAAAKVDWRARGCR